jgi:hypothetical protein
MLRQNINNTEGVKMQPTIFSMAVMPHPHIDFLDANMALINYTFAFALGGAAGVLLFVLISETYKYINE